jgi:protein-S-isoprenylcysteine O-methyltransferase Ste14
MGAALPVYLVVSVAVWCAMEVVLVVRDLVRRKAGGGHDRGTRAIVALSLGAAIALGSLLRRSVPSLDTPAPDVFGVAGLVVLWAGLLLRVWAVWALGGAFSTYVQVDADQAVVTRGPYRWVRHPSYTGLLLIAVGIGLGARNWLSLLVAVLVPALGLLPRIAVEEAELTRVLGERYRDYQKATRRLVPGVW